MALRKSTRRVGLVALAAARPPVCSSPRPRSPGRSTTRPRPFPPATATSSARSRPTSTSTRSSCSRSTRPSTGSCTRPPTATARPSR
ncbi:hypothetical protein ACFQV2_30800 [Actinokineospora soli]|uniref:Secreted protein n=1 Tax=Actinokineospora soli TaxID=1048753 RepID=A0ABW2TUK9_9PSEU